MIEHRFSFDNPSDQHRNAALTGQQSASPLERRRLEAHSITGDVPARFFLHSNFCNGAVHVH